MANRHAQDTRIILMQLPTEDDIYIASQSNMYIQNCTYHLQTNQIPASAFWVIFCILENQSLLPRANFFFHKLSSFRYSIIRQACIVMTSYEFYKASIIQKQTSWSLSMLSLLSMYTYWKQNQQQRYVQKSWEKIHFLIFFPPVQIITSGGCLQPRETTSSHMTLLNF